MLLLGYWMYEEELEEEDKEMKRKKTVTSF
jgi:hypothetical protein